jgi:hypothetical protein
MKKFSLKKKIAVAAGGVAVAGIVGTGAFAYWSSSGNGAGSATTGKSTAFTIAADNINLKDLTPGGPADTVTWTVTNPSTGHQFLHQTVVSVAKSDGTAWSSQTDGTKPACSANDFAIDLAAAGTPVTKTSPSGDLGPGATSASGSITVKMVNRSDTAPGDGLGNQDNCQNVTVPLYFSAS